MFLIIDAHSKNGITVIYNGRNPDKDGEPDDRTTPNYWLDFDGGWFEIKKSKRASWMVFAIQEAKNAKGVKEGVKPLFGMVEKYHKYVGITDNPDTTKIENSPTGVAWCSSFVSWCLGQAKYSNPKSVGSRFYLKNKGSDKTLIEIEKPIYGAIAVFSDCNSKGVTKSSGHVAFVFGKKTETDLLLLGGNQGNKLKISKYDCSKKVFLSWKSSSGTKHYKILRGYYIPKNYTTSPQDKLSTKDTYKSAKEANKALLNINIETNTNGESSR